MVTKSRRSRKASSRRPRSLVMQGVSVASGFALFAAGTMSGGAPTFAIEATDDAGGSELPSLPSPRTGDPAYDRVAELLDRIPNSADSAAPVLWSTRVEDRFGVPVRGAWVVAYIIENEFSDSHRNRQLVPVAKAESGRDGSLTIRLDPADVSQYLRDGYVNIWYVISAGGDFTLTADTVSTSGVRGSAWRTSLTEEVMERERLSAEAKPLGDNVREAVPSADFTRAIAEEVSRDQPDAVVVDVPPAMLRSSTPPGGVPTLCSFSPMTDYRARVTVGTMYMATNWSSSFVAVDQTVTQTQWNQTTSLSVPLTQSGAVQLTAGVGGTLAVTQRSTGGQITTGRAAAGGNASFRIRPQYNWARGQLACLAGAYPNAPTFYRLVTWPTRLRNDLFVDTQNSPDVPSAGSTLPTCNSNTLSVGSGLNYNRTVGQSETDYGTEYSFGLTVGLVGISVAGQSTTTRTQSQTQFWINGNTEARWICSSTGSLSGTPTIVATSRK